MACRAASPGAAEDPKLQEVRPPPVGTDSLRKVTKLGRERARLRPELAGADWVNPRLPAAGQRGKAGKYVARTRPRSMRSQCTSGRPPAVDGPNAAPTERCC